MIGVARRLVHLAVWVGLLGAGGVASADPEARRWLSDMSAALAGQTYAGEFLHIGSGPVETLRIAHRVRDGQVAERVVGRDATRREVIRHDNEMQVILPDQATVLIESASSAGTLVGVVPTFDSDVEAQYRVEFAGRARVIGRPARVVAVIPKDHYRFGYRLWLDEATRMPLRTDLTDTEGRVLEQMVFTALDFSPTLSDAAFHSTTDTSRFQIVRERTPTQPPPDHADAWTVNPLPPGYTVRSRTVERLPGTAVPSTHLLISDGLATVSVFIEELPEPPRRAVESEGRIGSAYAYSRLVAGHKVTAVGEVPAATVELLAGAVMPAAGARLDLGGGAADAPLTPRPASRPRHRP